jgi:putative FmdB family regulatory protein
MPLYDYHCQECGKLSEILLTGSSDQIECRFCGSGDLQKVLSAPSSMSGLAKNSMPGPGDTSCCGSTPGQAAGCAGPGSCCGQSF